jgi:hypothetical protein
MILITDDLCEPCWRIASGNALPDESADAERAQTAADHRADLIAEREMVQAQTPVVNVQEEAE